MKARQKLSIHQIRNKLELVSLVLKIDRTNESNTKYFY